MPDAHDPYIGRHFGNVLIKSKIGQGGMGMVYKGWHERFACEVAVKVLPFGRGQTSDDQYLQRFIREGRTAARIQHRNVVRVMDAGNAEGVSYLVLEFVDGSNLGDILDRKTKLGYDMVERLGRGIADGLIAIHKAGILHRDIKPDNILLGRDGVVKITDLGLARAVDDETANRLTATGMVVGTPLYVSPEAIRDNKGAGPPADVYSLGATLYHMLTGKPPFTGKTAYEVMRAHLDGRIQPVLELEPGVPKALARMVEQCLEKDPERRPPLGSIVKLLAGEQSGEEPRPSRTGRLAMTALVTVGILAIGAWLAVDQLLGDDTSDKLVIAPDAGLVRFDTGRRLEWRIGAGTWRTVGGGGIPLDPGEHTVQLRTTDSGPTWWSEVELTVRPESDQLVKPSFSPHRLATPVAIDLPAESRGLIMVNGTGFSISESQVVLQDAGRHAIGRWDQLGGAWWSTTVIVNEQQAVDQAPWQTAPRPGGDAWLRRHVEGRRCRPHHLVSWQEVQWAREQHPDITPNQHFETGARQPEQAATGLDHILVKALLGVMGDTYRLPNRSEATEFYQLYGTGIWADTGSGLVHEQDHNGLASLLILLPR